MHVWVRFGIGYSMLKYNNGKGSAAKRTSLERSSFHRQAKKGHPLHILCAPFDGQAQYYKGLKPVGYDEQTATANASTRGKQMYTYKYKYRYRIPLLEHK